MKKALNLTLMLVLAGSMSAIAQTKMSSDSSTKKDKMSGKKLSMTGCISERDGKYMMMNKTHSDGVALMTTEDLKPHVGHEVKVMGMMEKMAGTSEESKKSGGNMDHDTGMMGMKVSSMKMVSEHCDASKMMGK